MDFGETQKGLIILENDKYKIEIFKKKGDKMNKNTYTPSKELLSDVFNKEVLIISDDTEWVEEKTGESLRANDICIIFAQTDYNPYIILDKHALAHKVKEWAWYDQSYQISSYFITLELKQGMSAEDLRQQPVCQSCIANINGTLIEYFDANTEPEAIFQAGEWILSQTKLQ
jgi:hypothetical protein